MAVGAPGTIDDDHVSHAWPARQDPFAGLYVDMANGIESI